jgi:hypothetical protein
MTRGRDIFFGVGFADGGRGGRGNGMADEVEEEAVGSYSV